MNTVVLRQAISRLTHEYGPDAAGLAAMVFCARLTMRQAATAHGCPDAAECMVKTLNKCVESFCIDKDINPEAVCEVLHALDGDLSINSG